MAGIKKRIELLGRVASVPSELVSKWLKWIHGRTWSNRNAAVARKQGTPAMTGYGAPGKVLPQQLSLGLYLQPNLLPPDSPPKFLQKSRAFLPPTSIFLSSPSHKYFKVAKNPLFFQLRTLALCFARALPGDRSGQRTFSFPIDLNSALLSLCSLFKAFFRLIALFFQTN